MSFSGRSFIYDSVPSESYGLYIMDIDADAINRIMGSFSLDIMEQKLFRRSTPYFYGSTASPKLSFPFSAYSEQEMDSDLYGLVQKWLFSPRQYKKFQIDQYDLQNLYFNCLLTEPNVVKSGNMIQGFSCSILCDSPFAWKFPITTTYSYSVSVVDDTVIFNNSSDDSGDYLRPRLIVTMNNVGGDITIVNESDGGRIFRFTGLSAGESITIDNSLQIISSSTGLRRLSNFNKKFFRLVSGANTFRIQGNVESIYMITQFVSKKI